VSILPDVVDIPGEASMKFGAEDKEGDLDLDVVGLPGSRFLEGLFSLAQSNSTSYSLTQVSKPCVV
jgi:hypothetical protein